MSGDIVILEAAVTSVPYRAISRLSTTMSGLPGFALIGGLAVIARLGQAHRATNDIDAVSDDQVGLLEVLVADGLERRGDSVLLDADLKLDVIDVSEGDDEYLPFATHRFAFDTRSPVASLGTCAIGNVVVPCVTPTRRLGPVRSNGGVGSVSVTA